ncbi:MAG: hypothetical protein ACI9AV_001647, partial [Sediminicola sp.]
SLSVKVSRCFIEIDRKNEKENPTNIYNIASTMNLRRSKINNKD